MTARRKPLTSRLSAIAAQPAPDAAPIAQTASAPTYSPATWLRSRIAATRAELARLETIARRHGVDPDAV